MVAQTRQAPAFWRRRPSESNQSRGFEVCCPQDSKVRATLAVCYRVRTACGSGRVSTTSPCLLRTPYPPATAGGLTYPMDHEISLRRGAGFVGRHTSLVVAAAPNDD